MAKSRKRTKAKTRANNKRTRRRKRARTRNSNNLPAAQSSRNRSRFTTTQLTGSSVRVKGYDLVYASDEDESITQGAFCVIPCNPAYWTGTRVARIATAYSQYRPIKFSVHYFPQVSTMTNGLITAGTLWNNDTNPEAIQQALATSNSGKIYPVYTKTTHYVNLATCLSQNLFTFNGYLTNETNPFMFIATTQSYEGNVPGYYMVDYEYDFKNPIGEGSQYEAVTKTVGDMTPSDIWENTTGVLMTSSIALSIGTTFIVKLVEGAIQFFLNGSRLGVAADLVFKLFRSKSPSTMSDFDSIHGNTIKSFRFAWNTNNTMRYVSSDIIDIESLVQINQGDLDNKYLTGLIIEVDNEIPADGLIPTCRLKVISSELSAHIPDGTLWFCFTAKYLNSELYDTISILRTDTLTEAQLNAVTIELSIYPNAEPIIFAASSTSTYPLGDLFLPPHQQSDTIIGKGARVIRAKKRSAYNAITFKQLSSY